MFDHWNHRAYPQEIHGGMGVLENLGEMLKSFGTRRVLLITSSRIANSPKAELITKKLGRLHAGTFSDVGSYVNAHTAHHAVVSTRAAEADAIVSFGGGSVTDMAKAVSFFSEMESGISGRTVADRPMYPHVAIPTTLTGAPYTGDFALVDPHTKRSSSAGSPTSTPMAVLVDYSMQAGDDNESLIQRAVVALAHAIDVLTGTQATPEARMLARQGLIELARLLPALHASPFDLELHAPVIDAAVSCGRARQNAPAGFHHALVQLLGARTDTPYSLVSSSLLPYTTAFVSDVLPDATAELLNRLFAAEPSDLGPRMRQWLGNLGVTNALDDPDTDQQVDSSDLEAVARQATSQRGVQLCARPAGEGDVYALLEDAIGHK